ncbi:MAG: cobalamin biosynthesis protein CbiG, partial [Clostridia bacterium]|nr:cobalamin biosynthesis protein CbiG [Clostridia bacterium]
MNTALICFSDAGAVLAQRIAELLHLENSDIHSIAKFSEKYGFTSHRSVCADMGDLFTEHDALIFIGACGIAVRDIAPHLKNKTVDPAVLVLDDQGKFVIPILSGHIGGANALACHLAEKLGAFPVITTATDGNGKFSCDTWAVTHNCAISSMKTAKDISAAILTADVPV